MQARSPARAKLTFRPLSPDRMDDLRAVLNGTWGRGCWCLFPRLTDKELRALPGTGSLAERRRAAMAKLADRDRAPGLLAYDGNEPVGWIAVAPRRELRRVDGSRATPPVDDSDVWVIPCITVRKTARGRGIAVALVKAAADYAGKHGAAAVEAYPRAGDARGSADSIYFGTEPIFRRAGFKTVRGPVDGLPRNWLPRLAMRKSLGG